MREFVPTHRLIVDYTDSLKLPIGTLLRQVNPYAGGESRDTLIMYTEEDYRTDNRTPWLFVPDAVEPLPEWPAIREKMFEDMRAKAGWK